jgi:hypothetical protein
MMTTDEPTMEQARKRFFEVFGRFPVEDLQFMRDTAERLSRGEWEPGDLVAICRWRKDR